MKTLLEKLIVQLEFISHPAAGWFGTTTAAPRKRKKEREQPAILSPEGFNVRSAAKHQDNIRRTPAP